MSTSPSHWDNVTTLSDELLAADIVLLEGAVLDPQRSNTDAARFVELVTERHTRAMKRGAEQARRLLYVEKMLEELAETAPDGVFEGSYEVDDVNRDEDGRIWSILGTLTNERDNRTPYILGEV